jgi:hypothetical protein
MDGRVDPYQFDVGTARVEPDTPVVAGSFFTRKIIFTAGEFGSDEGGRILICRRLSCDMQLPQFSDPGGPGYVSATCSNPDVKLECFFIAQGYLDDWRNAVGVKITAGYLNRGDRIEVVMGDTTGGGPGMRMQTFPEKRHTFKVIADTFNTNYFYEAAGCPEIEVLPGEADAIHLVYPQTPEPGQPFDVAVRMVDFWGNPVRIYNGKITLDGGPAWKGLPDIVTLDPADQGIKIFPGVSVHGAGPLRLTASDDRGLKCVGPALVPRQETEPALFWGDAHGQTRSTVGTGTVEEYYSFARNKALVDIASWQGNDLRVRKEDWEEVLRETKRFNEPGRFVTLLGYEWSGLRSGGGDHNIYYSGDEDQIHRSSHASIEDYSDQDTDRFPITKLWDTFRGRKDVMAAAHVGGRCCNLDFFDPEFVRLIEVHSHHGTFEWLIEEAFDKGLRVGFTAASDDHTGRLGLVYPNRAGKTVATFDVKGGLMGLLAPELNREAVFCAMHNRRTYGTSGERILLSVKCGDRLMGEEFIVPDPPKIDIAVYGTAPLIDVEVMRGKEIIYSYPINRQSEGKKTLRRIRVQWSGVSQKSGRSKQVFWKGSIFVKNGSIKAAEGYALDQFDDRVQRISSQRVDFDTRTSGDFDGVMLDIDGREDTKLDFSCGFMRFSVSLAEISEQQIVYTGGRCNEKVIVSEVAADLAETDAVFSYTDTTAAPGCHPYWVRVSQLNGGQAWSSPMYIEQSI